MSFRSQQNVDVFVDVSKADFIDDIYPYMKPAVLRGVDIGPCVSKWTPDYLAKQGGEREVKIHVSPTSKMDFIHKNYAYRSLPFAELILRCSRDKQTNYFFQEDELYYLRSLGDDPRKGIADVTSQFPSLADDLHIPAFFDRDKFFSSVFRVGSANMQLWTHYDVMDNILMQVRGHKRVIFFSPQDANYLYLTGDKSAVMDLDNPDFEKYPDLKLATPYYCNLEPRDVLFIPALWFHNVVSLDFSVAVNVFWRHLDNRCYDNKDTYGNKDLVAASKALQIVQRAIKSLQDLPEEYRDFYGRRLVREIERKTYLTAGEDGERSGPLTRGGGRTSCDAEDTEGKVPCDVDESRENGTYYAVDVEEGMASCSLNDGEKTTHCEMNNNNEKTTFNGDENKKRTSCLVNEGR